MDISAYAVLGLPKTASREQVRRGALGTSSCELLDTVRE